MSRLSRTDAGDGRIAALDQFRGYTVAGMFLVNFLSDFDVVAETMRHHDNYCSYADTIMPQFFFAAGFAFRLALLRRAAADGGLAATRRALRRILGLALVALVVHAPCRRFSAWLQLEQLGFWGVLAEPLKRSWFETLMHIAVASLWALPVIRGSARTRLAWIALSGGLHVALSYWFNFDWVFTPPVCIDGGPFGFLTWSIPFLAGSLAHDLLIPVAGRQKSRQTVAGSGAPAPRKFRTLLKLLSWGIGAMVAGYLLSCGTRLYDGRPAENAEVSTLSAAAAGSSGGPALDLSAAGRVAPDPVWPAASRWRGLAWSDLLAEPPLMPPANRHRLQNYWMMSQRCGTLSYQVFSAGCCTVLFALFWLACDGWGLRSTILNTLGANALAAFILHEIVGNAVAGFAAADAPLWYVALLCAVFSGFNYLFLRGLEKQRLFLRL